MALAKSYAISLIGLNGTVVEVEADLSSNLPGFVIVGLPDASLSEAVARVKAATTNSGLSLPNRKLTVNLAPAALPKSGSSFDLAIAISALAASGLVSPKVHCVLIGELALNGELKPVRGVLPALMAAARAGFEHAIIPRLNAEEAGLLAGVNILPVSTLREAVEAISDPSIFERNNFYDLHKVELPKAAEVGLDFADVIGQSDLIESMIVAAAGGHNMLMVGSPGVGKTMLANRLPSILPNLDFEQQLETTAIHSICRGESIGSNVITRPPFQAPHHTASTSALIGGGARIPSPGVCSLAHNGVLFLDEAPEFQKPALEALRQVLESGELHIARAGASAVFPARFQLILAANPCPCGFALSRTRKCTCVPTDRKRYLNRLTGPLLDRVDLRVVVPELNAAQRAVATRGASNPSSIVLRERVLNARNSALARNSKFGATLNAFIPGKALKQEVFNDRNGLSVVERALHKGLISMRGVDRTLRVALTLADLDVAQPGQDHVVRALAMRADGLAVE